MPYCLGSIYLKFFKLICFSDFTCISSELTLLVKTKFWWHVYRALIGKYLCQKDIMTILFVYRKALNFI